MRIDLTKLTESALSVAGSNNIATQYEFAIWCISAAHAISSTGAVLGARIEIGDYEFFCERLVNTYKNTRYFLERHTLRHSREQDAPSTSSE